MSGSAIPASQIVSVVPSVLNAGGVGLDLNGLLLTTDTHVPLGEVYSFPDLTAVQMFFGPTSYISMLAGTYFLADINATKRPGALLITCCPYQQNVPAWLLSAQRPTLTLAQLQGTTPSSTISLTINGKNHTSQPISLSTATSFSLAAIKIGAALNFIDAPVSSLTAAFAGGVMTVSANHAQPPFGWANTIVAGDLVSGPGIPAGTYVVANLSGTSSAGTFSVNHSFARASQPNVKLCRNPCTWDAQTFQFRISSHPGNANQSVASSISHLTGWVGNLATTLGLNQGQGALLNPQGTANNAGGIPWPGIGGFMDNVLKVTQNWASFTHSFEPDAPGTSGVRQQFSAWVNSTQNNYMYCAWDTNPAPTLSPHQPSSLGSLLNTSLSSGTAPIYSPNLTNGRNLAMFMMGVVAAIDFNQLNGRKTIAFRGQTGITPDIINGVIAANLEANHYNYYGIWTTANDLFRFMYPGLVSGPYKWIDSYVNQIWMNNNFQLALMELLTQTGSIPYNQAGYTLIKAACQGVINQAVNFGAIRPGVTLSQSQIIEVNNMAAIRIDGVLSANGYYLQILDADPQVRVTRGTPPMTFWYMDGGSIQRLSLASVMVQ